MLQVRVDGEFCAGPEPAGSLEDVLGMMEPGGWTLAPRDGVPCQWCRRAGISGTVGARTRGDIVVAQALPDVRRMTRWTADSPFADSRSLGHLLTSTPAPADYAVEEGLPVGATSNACHAAR